MEKKEDGEDASGPDRSIVEERLAEAKVGAGVKDRLGTWTGVKNSGNLDTKSVVEERLADIKGAGSIKDRLNVWANKKADDGSSDPEQVAARLAEAKSETGAKDRANLWSEQANKKEDFVRKDPIKIPDTEPTLDEVRLGTK